MKKILLTCDTEVGLLEVPIRKDAFEVFIEGKINSEEVGYKFINKIASKYKAKVEHFVDIYAYEKVGEKKFANLCNNILEMGHNISLHTHPSHKYDSKRKFMHQYSLAEQKEIIEHGKEKIHEWTKKEVRVHRAGGYGMNLNTLRALKCHDFKIDCSYFKGHQNCLYQKKVFNRLFLQEGILEIPVSVFQNNINYWPGAIKRKVMTKLDFRYGADTNQILRVIEQAPDNVLIVLFLHSFNFLNRFYDFKLKRFKRITINRKLIIEYEKLLAGIKDRLDCEFISLDQIDNSDYADDYLVDINTARFMGNALLGKVNNLFRNRYV
ncbi:hypothetical protein HOC37_01720 [bacterium]|jgi:peptidoglycan/xylan/chitin deacetylase (PgdA/CDA1 family)|nr:hypothetical protein [bacterium]MBT3581962.1 hypothetical protein [bacterium]MBT4551685.1 hypothetical protein [bacterium]MBT7087607.1 hypothetical protein [bacterium]